MTFYFYTNKNIMFDFLARNMIAPDAVIRDIKRYRTISTASDYYLFVTHKKLDRKSREHGIGEPEFVYPVTLEIAELPEEDALAILVSRDETGLNYTLKALSRYDVEKHIGAYLIGEIPLSRVEKIYFDTQDDQDMFSRPSPDYWYPANKYALLPDDFTEELFLEPENDKLIEANCAAVEDVLSGIRRREKKRAAVLNFVNGTQHWRYDRYSFNMDSSLQQLLDDLQDGSISSILPHYEESKGKDNVEPLCLVDESLEKTSEINQIIYDHICDALSEQPYSSSKQPEQLIQILNTICEQITLECQTPPEKAIVRQTLTEIENLISDVSAKGPEEIMANIPEAIDSLKALLFVAKNPNRYDLFLEALEVYHADQITKRRAAVLWGLLNGLYGMPGEGFNKDNQQLWQFIEAFVYDREKHTTPSLAIISPKITLENGDVLGIPLKEERIVTASEIREAILSMPKERLTKAFYSKILEASEVEAGSKKKAVNKGYAHCVASISLSEIKEGEVLDSNLRKLLEQLLKDCKTPVPNKEKLFVDYVENEEKFAFVFSMDPEYWKKAYIKVLGKKNA